MDCTEMIKMLNEASKQEYGAILNLTSCYLMKLPGFGKFKCPNNFFKVDSFEVNESLMTKLMHM